MWNNPLSELNSSPDCSFKAKRFISIKKSSFFIHGSCKSALKSYMCRWLGSNLELFFSAEMMSYFNWVFRSTTVLIFRLKSVGGLFYSLGFSASIIGWILKGASGVSFEMRASSPISSV